MTRVIIIGIAVGQVLDVATFVAAYQTYGLAYEVNPITHLLVGSLGLAGAELAKLAVAGLACLGMRKALADWSALWPIGLVVAAIGFVGAASNVLVLVGA